MSGSGIDIDHLCNLAALALSGEERAGVETDLAHIMAMVDSMRSIDTEGVTPLAHPLDAGARLRADAVTERIDRDRYQADAPSTRDGLYLVPRVVE